MEALSLSSAKLAFTSSSHLIPHHYSRFLFLSSPPIFHKLQSSPSISRISLTRPSSLTIIRCSGSFSFTSKPLSELRKRNESGSGQDEKLRALREVFTKPGVGIDAYIIPSQDAHQSEFIAECYMRRAYISGFTGSAGTAVVTKDKAALWTDGRYFLQAEKQLSSSWILMRAGNVGVPTTAEWLNDVLAPGSKVGIDPFLFSFDAAEELKEDISKKNLELVLLSKTNLVDEIWKEGRPKPPSAPVRLHELKYAGVDVPSKLSWLRSQLANAGCSAIVITMLDEIAWLLNLRGNDVPNSPVTYAYLIVEMDGAKLFIDDCKITSQVMDHLKTAGVELRPYDSILKAVENLAVERARLLIDSATVNAAIVNTFKSVSKRHDKKGKKSKSYDSVNGQSDEAAAIYSRSPISMAKALKNHAEIEGMRNSHLRDAAALAQFWAWLEYEIQKGVTLTEVEVADKLLEFRSKQDGFLDTSFDTISGSGPNGAIIHYKPEPDSCSVVDPGKLFLLDSGAQYIDGTTDITRTVHFGEPTAREKECFTRVLQGHIALDQAVFPENTPGFVLDAFARSSLWKIGLDYRHGTGHGVGAALNVHEGPQSISFRFGNMTPLQKGMIVSNEPGYYEDHAFGIRIENLLCVKEIHTPNRYGGIEYQGRFWAGSTCPTAQGPQNFGAPQILNDALYFQRGKVEQASKMIDLSLLSAAEVDWVNDYHEEVWQKVSPLLDDSSRQWLWENTRPLTKQGAASML